MRWQYDDGGRKAAGYKGKADDCVVRAIAIASQLSYQTVYDAVNAAGRLERPLRSRRTGRISRPSSARTGVFKHTYKQLLEQFGWRWTPTMRIGSGTRVHLRDGELPMGRIIVQTSKHIVAVIDGVIHDTRDPSRGGTRCVYGYWSKKP